MNILIDIVLMVVNLSIVWGLYFDSDRHHIDPMGWVNVACAGWMGGCVFLPLYVPIIKTAGPVGCFGALLAILGFGIPLVVRAYRSAYANHLTPNPSTLAIGVRDVMIAGSLIVPLVAVLTRIALL